MATLAPDIHSWVTKHVGTIHVTEKLKGGISTSMYRLTTQQGAYVLRVIDNPSWLAEEPDLALHEASALQAVANLKIPTPQLIAFDNGTACSIPVVLSTCLPGRVVLMPHDFKLWLQELAQTLVTIHQLHVPHFKWEYRAWISLENLSAPPTWMKTPHLWSRALELLHHSLPQAPIRLIHRDYHPANVLFQDGRITGIVDWINACRGAIHVDVATCRVDLMCLHGIDVANQFLEIYEAAASIQHHPIWDLHALMDFFDTEDNVSSVLQTWLDLGRTDLTASLLYERADAYLVDIMRRL